jgi:hypothetical protein
LAVGPGSLGRYAPPPFTPDAGPRRSPRRTCRAYPHAHLGLVGLEQLPAHADGRLVAHVGVAQQQHSWVRARAWAWGSGGLTYSYPACLLCGAHSASNAVVSFFSCSMASMASKKCGGLRGALSWACAAARPSSSC